MDFLTAIEAIKYMKSVGSEFLIEVSHDYIEKISEYKAVVTLSQGS